MSGAVQSLLPGITAADDQSILVELINKRITEKRRAELVAEVHEARRASKMVESDAALLKT